MRNSRTLIHARIAKPRTHASQVPLDRAWNSANACDKHLLRVEHVGHTAAASWRLRIPYALYTNKSGTLHVTSNSGRALNKHVVRHVVRHAKHTWDLQLLVVAATSIRRWYNGTVAEGPDQGWNYPVARAPVRWWYEWALYKNRDSF